MAELPQDAILWRLGETPRALKSITDEVIFRCLEFRSWNQTHAARDLKMSLRTLRKRVQEMRAMGVDIPSVVSNPKNGGYPVRPDGKRLSAGGPPKWAGE